MSDTIKYENYLGTVQYSQEDNVFYGRVTGINDLVTFEGKSVNELNSAFKEAVEDYKELCKIAGKPTDKSYKGSFNVRITPELHRELSRKSVELGLSLNQLVELAIAEKLNQNQNKHNTSK